MALGIAVIVLAFLAAVMAKKAPQKGRRPLAPLRWKKDPWTRGRDPWS
jgi:hypothetical protein